jgi:hypothetical protein
VDDVVDDHLCNEDDQSRTFTSQDLVTLVSFRAHLDSHTLDPTRSSNTQQCQRQTSMEDRFPRRRYLFTRQSNGYVGIKPDSEGHGSRLPHQSFRDVHTEGGVQTDQFCEAADAVIQFFGVSGIFLSWLQPHAHVWNDARSLQQCGFLGSAERPQ